MNPWAGCCVADMLDRSASIWPAQTAIADGDIRITYRQLRERRDALAAQFAAAGVRQGTHVGLLLGNRWQTVVSVFAVLYLGGRVVPFNPSWESPEIQYALGQAEVELLLAASHYRGAELAPKLAGAGIRSAGTAEITALPRLKSVILWNRDGRVPGENSLETLLETRSPPPPRGELQEAFLLYTSGSTAQAKGALLRQDAALGTSFYFGDRLGLTDDDRFLNTLPFHHGGGLITHLLGVLQRGAAIYLFEAADQDGMASTLNTERCTAMGGFDIVNMGIIRGQRATGLPLSIEKMQVTTAAAFAELSALGVKCSTVYALTEASNFVTMTRAGTTVQQPLGNGNPFPGIEVQIRDYRTGERLPAGEPGEICFRGWNTMVGYYRMPERTSAAFDADGFLHTGDYGWTDLSGQLYYRGRYAAMIKTGGENVSELEVELFLTSAVPGVINAGVVGIPDQRWGEIVIAFVETEGLFDSDMLRSACRGKLARYKIPKHFFRTESGDWPVTPTGKLVKAELRRRAAAILGVTRESRPPR